MRFLVDECLSARLATLLTGAGHDAVHVSACNLLGAPDEEVLDAAAAGSRVLLSADTDFGELLAGRTTPSPSLILFRRPGRTADEHVAVLLANFPDIEDELLAGAVVVFAADRLRVRRLPFRYPPAGN